MSVNNYLTRYAFSLVELIIVVVIMGLVYTLSITNIQSLKESPTNVSIQNLKEYLNDIPHTENVELLCLDDCSRCSVLVDSKVYSSTSAFDEIIDDSIKVYSYDFYSGAQEQSKKVYFNSEDVEEDVCFSFSIDKKGIGDQVFVEFKNKFYDFTTYLEPTPVYFTLKDLVDYKESLSQEIMR